MRELRINVFGRVQGVNFRNNIKRFCDDIGLQGFARNMNDGSVWVVAQGTTEQLDKLLDFVTLSPGLSKVKRVDREFYKVNEKMLNFIVLHEGNFLNDKRKALRNLGKEFSKTKL